MIAPTIGAYLHDGLATTEQTLYHTCPTVGTKPILIEIMVYHPCLALGLSVPLL